MFPQQWPELLPCLSRRMWFLRMGPEAPTGWLVWCVKVLLLIIDIYIWYITPIYTNYTSSITQLCLWFKPTSWYNDNQNGWVPTSPNTPELGTTCIYPVPICSTVAPRTASISNFCLEMDPVFQGKIRYIIWSRNDQYVTAGLINHHGRSNFCRHRKIFKYHEGITAIEMFQRSY